MSIKKRKTSIRCRISNLTKNIFKALRTKRAYKKAIWAATNFGTKEQVEHEGWKGYTTYAYTFKDESLEAYFTYDQRQPDEIYVGLHSVCPIVGLITPKGVFSLDYYGDQWIEEFFAAYKHCKKLARNKK